MDRDGGNPVQVTHGKGEIPLSVSSDGRWVLYVGLTGQDLWKVSTDGGAPVQLADQSLGEAEFSPDGKSVVLNRYIEEGGLLRRNIAVVSTQDGKPTAKPIPWPDGYGLRWAPAGDALTYVKETDGVGNLWRQALDGSAPKPITDFTNLQLFTYAWAPDGGRVFLSRGQITRDAVLITDFH